METHTGWTITFWVVVILFGLHYIFIYLPHAASAGTLNGASIIGSLILPVGISFIVWIIKVRADRRLNEENEDENEDE